LRGGSRTFLDFFWVPRVTSPAGFAEDEVGHTLDKGNTVRELLITFPAGHKGLLADSRGEGCKRVGVEDVVHI
tara:strand:+ start:271 stop:489 length:219 start_codon:yes stop_codon:yes gene_type:complete